MGLSPGLGAWVEEGKGGGFCYLDGMRVAPLPVKAFEKGHERSNIVSAALSWIFGLQVHENSRMQLNGNHYIVISKQMKSEDLGWESMKSFGGPKLGRFRSAAKNVLPLGY